MRHRSAAHVRRFSVFVIVQSLSVALFVGNARPSKASTLGYLFDSIEETSPDGRLRLYIETRGGGVASVRVEDTTTKDNLQIVSVDRPYTGLKSRWTNDSLTLEWFSPASGWVGGCEGDYSGFFWLRQKRIRKLDACWESREPLLCILPTRPNGLPCDRRADCDSQKCVDGLCQASAIGETCVSNESCHEGTCVGRVCTLSREHCDDDKDCRDTHLGGPYCYRLDNEVVGTCYAGEPGDPCLGRCVTGAKCERDEDGRTRTCRAGPLYGLEF